MERGKEGTGNPGKKEQVEEGTKEGKGERRKERQKDGNKERVTERIRQGGTKERNTAWHGGKIINSAETTGL